MWLSFILLAGLLFYLPSLKYGFSQDDFIHLFASRANTLGDFLNFFNPFYQYPDIFFFRPLTTQFYFFTNHFLFGLNPLPFRIEGLVLHLINSLLFYALIQRIWRSKQIAFISALFYSISAAHFLSLYYISAFQETGRMFFILLSFLTFFNYLESKKKLMYVFSVVAFIGALLSKETSVTLPFLLFPLEILRREDKRALIATKGILKSTILFFIITLIYGVIRFSGFQSVFNEGAYTTTFSISEVLQNFKWYIIWSLGLPEVLSTYPSLKPSSLIQFGKDLPFGNMVLKLSIILLVLIGTLSSQLKLIPKRVLISATIFMVSLGPVLILNQHRYPQYLDLSFIGLFPILALLFSKPAGIRRYLGTIGIIFFIALQFFSLKLSEQTHWTTHRAKVTKYYYEYFRNIYPNLPDDTSIVFAGTRQASYELSIALARQYAFLVWYSTKIKSVSYQTEYRANTQEKTITINPITVY